MGKKGLRDHALSEPIEISKNHLSLSYKKTTIYSRIIQDTYPDYEKVIPIDNEKTLYLYQPKKDRASKIIKFFEQTHNPNITIKLPSVQFMKAEENMFIIQEHYYKSLLVVFNNIFWKNLDNLFFNKFNRDSSKLLKIVEV